ncbi:MAG: hypothetical protein ACOYI5_10865 [Christensenellales bacterium]|jgi:hypothetical protein
MELNLSTLLAIALILIPVIRKLLQKPREEPPRGQTEADAARGRTPAAPPARPQSAQVEPWGVGSELMRGILTALEIDVPSAKPAPEPAYPADFAAAFEPPEPAAPIVEAYAEGTSMEGPEEIFVRPALVSAPPAAPARPRLFENGAQLRRAVVMSEVLGKPVSLRGKNQNGRLR